MKDEDELLVSRDNRLGRIRLNRPKALNSLTLGMVRAFSWALREFASDPAIAAVLVTGEGERGLCAGGDIRALYELRGGDKTPYKIFWREEYALNAAIAAFPKPYVVLMDGLVMGGGVGVSAHGNRRIVTERTRLAMPETGIGFIPDVGGTWLLTRKNGAGVYLALSGATIGAADALDLGLADTLIESSRLAQFVERLTHISCAADVDAAVTAFEGKAEAGELSRHERAFEGALSADCAEDVIATLHASDDAFARAAAAEIAGKSPTSLKVTHALLKRAKAADRLEDCLVDEYRAACSLLDGHDLYEGIRAAVVDKDKKPKWSPDSLAGVDDATVARILAGTGDPDPVFATSPH